MTSENIQALKEKIKNSEIKKDKEFINKLRNKGYSV